MKPLYNSKLWTSLLVALALGTTANAITIPITGVISFNGGQGTYLTGHTGIASYTSASTVNVATGSFTSALNLPANFYAPWSFNSGAISNFWTAGIFTFDLTSSLITSASNLSITSKGTGTMNAVGFSNTPGTFEFTSNPGLANMSFGFTAAASSVPDGGTTVALLGVSLLGLYGTRRKFGKP